MIAAPNGFHLRHAPRKPAPANDRTRYADIVLAFGVGVPPQSHPTEGLVERQAGTDSGRLLEMLHTLPTQPNRQFAI